jgi:hypothetical protein
MQCSNLELIGTLEFTSESQLKQLELPNVHHLVLNYPEYVESTGNTVSVYPPITGLLNLNKTGACLAKKLTLDSNG